MHGANYRRSNGQAYAQRTYIKGKPQNKIAKFHGGKRGSYDSLVQLVINERIQIRHAAIEACRLAANKRLEKTTGESGYFSRLRIYPHILLRENKQIATAGADRISQGMRGSFGKAVDLAARVRPGQVIMEMEVKREHVEAARKALRGACVKLPGTPSIRVLPVQQ